MSRTGVFVREKGIGVPTHQVASMTLSRHACQRYGQPGESYHYVPISCLITQFFRKCTSKWRRFLLTTDCLDLRGLDKRNSNLQVTLCEPGTRSRCWTGGSEERIERRSKILRYAAACIQHLFTYYGGLTYVGRSGAPPVPAATSPPSPR